MSIASALRAASVGPDPADCSSRRSTSSFSTLKRSPTGFLASGGAALSHRLGNFVEQALLAAQPAQAKGLNRLGTIQRSCIVRGLPLQRGKRLVQRGLVKCRQIGNGVLSSFATFRIKHCMQRTRELGCQHESGCSICPIFAGSCRHCSDSRTICLVCAPRRRTKGRSPRGGRRTRILTRPNFYPRRPSK